MKYKCNTNNVWTILCFMLYFLFIYFFSTTSFEYIFNFGPPCSSLLIDLVPMRKKFYNIIQCKDMLDPPFHYNNVCTFKWFLEHNNEMVCIQTLMLIFPGKISLRHDIIMHNFLSAYYLYTNCQKVYIF